MKVIIGGYAQGKLEYVLRGQDREKFAVCDGELPAPEARKAARDAGKQVIVNHLHRWVKEQTARGACMERKLAEFLRDCPDCIFICDEIGNGIVPLDAQEREYRERTGRILIELAEQADEVIRVVCGIGQKIK